MAKKVGTSGRWGARYGALARKTVSTIERVMKNPHTCARCGAVAVHRIHTAIWECQKCSYQFAGGAYTPVTGAGQGADKALKGIQDKLLNPSAETEA